jgi:hypothetical protein
MYRSMLAGAMLAAAMTTLSAAGANAQQFQANLTGFEEVGGLGAGETGAVRSASKGTLTLNLNQQLGTLNYTLTYSPGLTTAVTQAHIHFGKIHVAGGVIVFLCTNLGNGPAGTPTCPNPSGTVSSSVTGGNVVGPAAQNIPAGDFAGLVDALLSDTAYGNVHTTKFPSGEIRGQILQSENQQGNQNQP